MAIWGPSLIQFPKADSTGMACRSDNPGIMFYFIEGKAIVPWCLKDDGGYLHVELRDSTSLCAFRRVLFVMKRQIIAVRLFPAGTHHKDLPVTLTPIGNIQSKDPSFRHPAIGTLG